MLQPDSLVKNNFGHYGIACPPENFQELVSALDGLARVERTQHPDYFMLRVTGDGFVAFAKVIEECCEWSSPLCWLKTLVWKGRPRAEAK
jgi:hypothetical protein